MDAQRIAVDAIVVLTGCDRDEVAAFIRRLYLSGVKDPEAPDLQGPAGGTGLKRASSDLSSASVVTSPPSS